VVEINSFNGNNFPNPTSRKLF